MNVAALQRIDRWVGIPLCFVLTCARRLGDVLAGGGDPPPPVRKVLFIKLAEQGSTVLAYPALRRAAERYGRENVYFLVFSENQFILKVLDVIPAENIIPIEYRGLAGLALSLLRAIARVRAMRFDAAIDMEFFTRGSASITYLTGARCRSGFHSYFGAGPYRGDLMTHRLQYNPYWHTGRTFQLLVEALQSGPGDLPTFSAPPPASGPPLPQIAPEAAEAAKVRALLEREGGGGRRLLLLNPNASDLMPLRRWEPERYIELARRLLARYPDTVIGLTGAPGEAPAIERLQAAIGSPRCFSLAGKTSLRELLVVYTQAEVLVTNDSGPAHFAALTPIHVVTLFGPETPQLYAAPTPRQTALWAGLACSPCVNAYNNRQSACRNNLCMQQLSVELVFATVCQVYEGRLGENSSLSESGFWIDSRRH